MTSTTDNRRRALAASEGSAVAGAEGLRLSWATGALRMILASPVVDAHVLAQAGLDLADADEEALNAAGNDDALSALREAALATPPSDAGRGDRDEELADVRAYAKALQVALTGLTWGGSEFFVRHGEEFRADIPACIANVRRRYVNATRRANDAQLALKNERGGRGLVEALTRAWEAGLTYGLGTEVRSRDRQATELRMISRGHDVSAIVKRHRSEAGGEG